MALTLCDPRPGWACTIYIRVTIASMEVIVQRPVNPIQLISLAVVEMRHSAHFAPVTVSHVPTPDVALPTVFTATENTVALVRVIACRPFSPDAPPEKPASVT